MAKIIHQQIAIMHKLFNSSTPLYYRYKPELVLGSANMILYWDRSIVIGEKVDCNRLDIVLIVRENTTAPLIEVAVLLAHILTKTETKTIMNYENLALAIRNIVNFNPKSSQQKEQSPKLPKISR